MPLETRRPRNRPFHLRSPTRVSAAKRGGGAMERRIARRPRQVDLDRHHHPTSAIKTVIESKTRPALSMRIKPERVL